MRADLAIMLFVAGLRGLLVLPALVGRCGLGSGGVALVFWLKGQIISGSAGAGAGRPMWWRSRMGVNKPFAVASEENKVPILAVLQPRFAEVGAVLEIGGGTGQHAVFFAERMPHVRWQCSDRRENLAGIRQWIAEANLPNLPAPLALDVSQEQDWPAGPYDAVFSANTAHIMSLPEVEAMFLGVGRLLRSVGCFALYGPFSCDGRHNSPSNAHFDQHLRARDPASGVRDLRTLESIAGAAGLRLEEDCPMPVNNRTLIWRCGSP
jgi:hypothetical protein